MHPGAIAAGPTAPPLDPPYCAANDRRATPETEKGRAKARVLIVAKPMPLPRLSQSPTEPSFVQDPYPVYDQARALGPLVFWEDYGCACTTTFEATGAVLRDRRLGRAPLTQDAPPPHLAPFHAVEQHSLLQLEPPQHSRLRGLVLRAFTSRRVAQLGPEIAALCRARIAAFPEGPFDLLEHYATPVPVTVIARLLGVPESMGPDLLHWSNTMVAMYQARRDFEIERAAATAAQDFAAFLRGYIEERRASPADDLITHLIAAEEDGETLSTDEMISTCVLLLNAGHEATVHTIGNAVKTVLEQGRDPAWLCPSAMEATVEEVMRFEPPLHLFTRIAYEDMDLYGHPVARGDTIGCLLGAAARDPARTPDPHRFDPLRGASAQHLSLGAGIHFCVGAPLARLEPVIALQTLFDACPRLALAETPRWANLYHFHGLERLMVTV